MTEGWIADDDWQTIVANVPIVSVDLVVLAPDGVVLGRRVNEPARGEWFVPGGRLHKGESLEVAVHRLADEELGVDVEIRDRLGAYEHRYETADVADAGGKHYVPVAFVVETAATVFDRDDQHGDLRTFEPDELPALHEYVDAYLRDAGVLEE